MLNVRRLGTSTTVVASRRCVSESASDLVRIRLCASPPRQTCAEDDGIAYCGVIELRRAALMAVAGATSLSLNGETRFTFRNPNAYEVHLDDVAYIPTTRSDAFARVWMEERCFCTPVSLVGTQTLTGTMRVERVGMRVRGSLSLEANGVLPPSTWLTQRVNLATDFDLPLPP